MKLIYIANSRIPTEKAHGIQIMQMCDSFAKKGFEVELLIPKRMNKIKKDPFSYYGIKSGFKVKKLFSLDFIFFDKYIGHLGLWMETIVFFFSVLFYVLFNGGDILYTRDKIFSVFGFLGKKVIFEAHTFPKNYFLYGLLLKKTKGVVTITDSLKALFAEKGIREDRILVAPDAVDLEKFDIKKSKEQCRRELNLPQGKKIVLYAGHLYLWKGADVLAASSEYLEDGVLIVFVGGTEEDIKSFKSRTSKFKKIFIAGHKPHQEMPLWLKAADVLILPNSAKEEVSRKWTSPLKLFEYMASGRPIVASDLPSMREILNEKNAILVPPDDPAEMAAGIEKVLGSENLSKEISGRAFESVKMITWQERVNRISEFFGLLKL